jgi:starch synthase
MTIKTIKSLFLAAEADPLVKVGGLGDVAGSLPKALRILPAELTGGYEIDVRLVLPFHSAIRKKIADPAHICDFEIPTPKGPITAHVHEADVNGIHTYFISGPPIGDSAPVYSPDAAIDGPKYFFFSLAALELAKKINWQMDILHANDWHTALAVYALKLQKKTDPFFADTRSILTIHNLPFMGVGTEAAFDEFGLPPSKYPRLPWWARKFPLPLGLQTADRIVAVSPTYAQEILTPEYGCGLDTFLNGRKKAITGIVNGLDQESWNPVTDAIIPKNFSSQTLDDRQANKTALIKEFGLDPDSALPLLILISRMDPQKGVDLALEGLRQAAVQPWQAILLGTGDPVLEAACLQLEKDFPTRIRAAIRFDAALSRRMYAGADILLMPSRYEPCGLAQMMAMRYGCVPLARATGGLQDTIRDTDTTENGTGFLFKPPSAAAFVETLFWALSVYQKPGRWAEIQKQGMMQDFSWQRSAFDYAKIYQSLKEGNK